MNNSFGDSFVVEMSILVLEDKVLKEHRTTCSNSEGIELVSNRCAEAGGQLVGRLHIINRTMYKISPSLVFRARFWVSVL